MFVEKWHILTINGLLIEIALADDRLSMPRPIVQLLLVFLRWIQSLYFELYSSKFDDITFVQIVVCVMVVWFGVADDYQHLLVVFWVRIVDDWRLGVVLDNVISMLDWTALQRKHRSRWVPKDVVSTDQLHFIADEDDFSTRVCFDVFLLNIFAFVVKQPMRIPSPGDAPHVNFKLWLRLRWSLLNDDILGFSQLLNKVVMLFLDRNELIWINGILLLVGQLLIQETTAFEGWFVWRHVSVFQLLFWRIIAPCSILLVRFPSCLLLADDPCLPHWTACIWDRLDQLLDVCLSSWTVDLLLDYFFDLLLDLLLWSFWSPRPWIAQPICFSSSRWLLWWSFISKSHRRLVCTLWRSVDCGHVCILMNTLRWNLILKHVWINPCWWNLSLPSLLIHDVAFRHWVYWLLLEQVVHLYFWLGVRRRDRNRLSCLDWVPEGIRLYLTVDRRIIGRQTGNMSSCSLSCLNLRLNLWSDVIELWSLDLLHRPLPLQLTWWLPRILRRRLGHLLLRLPSDWFPHLRWSRRWVQRPCIRDRITLSDSYQILKSTVDWIIIHCDFDFSISWIQHNSRVSHPIFVCGQGNVGILRRRIGHSLLNWSLG